jgi:hypothetical protein
MTEEIQEQQHQGHSWIQLKMLLNGLLHERRAEIKLRIESEISGPVWSGFATPLCIAEALEYLKSSRGTKGLESFRKILEDMNQLVSIEAIKKSEVSHLFGM